MPVARRNLPIRAVVMEHAHADVGEQALADQRRLRSHAGIAIERGVQAALVARAHLVPQPDRRSERPALGLAHRQRAVREAPCLLDLHEAHRLAQGFHHGEALRRGGGKAVEFRELRRELALRGADVGERHVLEPALAAFGVGEFRRGAFRELGKLHGAASYPNTSR